MKDKRQGNDLKVAWSIFMQDGEPFRLDGKDVSLYLKNMFGRKELNDFVTTGNIIQWTFYGKDQKNSGKYSLELVINEGEKGMITTDKCDFVNLVSCSCKLQGGEDAPNVETESIELTSTLEYVAGGGSYDDTALWRALDDKVDKVEGLGLSEENYTTEDKAKLEGLENYDDTEIRQELTNLSERVEENEVLIEDLQNTKIDKEADDYYPWLSVGLADNLAGVDVVDSEISFRRSGGGAISDGVARIEAIKGNSVVWNQIVNAALIGGLNYGNPQIETTDSGIIYTFTEDGNFEYGDGSRLTFGLGNNIVANHKYAVLIDVKTPSTGIQIFVGEAVWDRLPVTPNTLSRIGRIQTITEVNNNYKTQGAIYPIASGASVVSGDVLEVYNPIVYDLTKMFGAGNEPTTIEEFNARKPFGIDENAYNEGEVIHMDVQRLESVGVNQWDEEWESGTIAGMDGNLVDDATKIRTSNLIRVLPNKEYNFTQPSQLPIRVFLYGADKAYKAYEYITSSSFLIPSDVHYIKVVFEYATYNNDICINLSDASINGKYFPYVKRTEDLSIIRKYFPQGMKSARAAHDEIRNNKTTQKWEKVQRIGSVDLGSLTWVYFDNSGYLRGWTNGIPRAKGGNTTLAVIANSICHKYPCIDRNKLIYSGVDNSHALENDNEFSESLVMYVRDSSYTNAASFKAAMQGVILYYELAEPIVTELDQSDQFKDLDYQVWNAGTEKAIAEGKSAPLAADITYGFNAIGKIKELEEKLNNGGGGYDDSELRYIIADLDNQVTARHEEILNLQTSDAVQAAQLTELSAEVGKKVGADFVNNAIAEAIGEAIDGGY